jgi:hypothetical protein
VFCNVGKVGAGQFQASVWDRATSGGTRAPTSSAPLAPTLAQPGRRRARRVGADCACDERERARRIRAAAVGIEWGRGHAMGMSDVGLDARRAT